MSSQSDIQIDASKFRPEGVLASTTELNKKLMAMTKGQPEWYDIGANVYREKRLKGETVFPAPVLLDCAKPFEVPSREAGRTIPCRLIKPANGSPSGVYMHIHGGGWVIGDHFSQDGMLKGYTDATNLVVISVGYRLAPEHPFPAPTDDCYDVAEWLVDNAEKEFGAPLKFIGGESAGGHLTALTALHLLSHQNPTYSGYQLKALILNYGVFDLTKLPTVFTFQPELKLVLGQEGMTRFIDAFLPDPKTDRKDPSISPLYFDFASLQGRQLPPALFVCGTADPLLDDTMFMTVKWQMVGGEALAKIVPGAAHGFTMFPAGMYPAATEIVDFTYKYMNEKM
ncbi:hypothetical protein FQN57_005405 [Myotisia sp. PD_48]|nr:hypothetical protein FQN57_005405 [Myotisia sp. PD_48]